jgi:NB-ARC domain-containing protein
MGFVPIDKMWERVDRARESSDADLFNHLMYLSEMVTKLVAASLVSAIMDDQENHRYRQLHRLIRSDGIGDWSSVIDEVLTGPAAQHLIPEVSEERRELTQNTTSSAWQYSAVYLLHRAVKSVEPDFEELQGKLNCRRWFSLFAILRNKTRGHGAPPTSIYGKIVPDLETSLRTFANNFCLFNRPWAYLHRNLNGKYRVTSLSVNVGSFNKLKKETSVNLIDGVYIFFDKPIRIELIESDVDAMDFFFPNGSFRDKQFELISYHTGNKAKGDAVPYLRPANAPPASETQGIGILDTQGKCFGNLPPAPRNYIRRDSLETTLYQVLINDRHPVITLLGRGGIGKTCLALSVLYQVCTTDRFGAILWFSARDTDLMPEGPKLVKPSILTTFDIAEELVRLMRPAEIGKKESIEYLSKTLTKSPIGDPILFVFDNFETVTNPIELYNWVDTYIRLPNKVLITTRIRDFKGDYPVEVFGMNEQESEELINTTAGSLGIISLLTASYCQDIYRESDGHPYVIKMLLGEVAKAGKLVKVERIVASRDDILTALFERTYSSLSPVAKRVFLTLCNWRSVIPQLAIEAVLLRPDNEKIDVTQAIEELSRSSFIEATPSEEDTTLFLSVPLVATVFGRNKLAVSPMRSAVEADTKLLHMLGAAQKSDIKRGVGPRIERMIRGIAKKIGQRGEGIQEYAPMLEFIARNYYPAWLLLTSLYEESGLLDKAKEALASFLESPDKVEEDYQLEAWERLISLSQRTGDWAGEVHALAGMCQIPSVPFSNISNAANDINRIIVQIGIVWRSEEKRIIVRQVAEVMEKRMELDDVSATDCSRLAWLFIHLRDDNKARILTKRGLELEPDNHHCQNLANKLLHNE